RASRRHRELCVCQCCCAHLAMPDEPALALHDALPISRRRAHAGGVRGGVAAGDGPGRDAAYEAREPREGVAGGLRRANPSWDSRSEEHTSELQSRENVVCRLLLENKNLEATGNNSHSR